MKETDFDFVVIGGGAAGFFGALSAAHHNNALRICIIEKTTKLLSKVKVSGGGRCNVTNSTFNVSELVKNYPRGGKELKLSFHQFTPNDTIRWFAERGVELKTEEDGRIFPISDNSQTIIDCFLNEATNYGISIAVNTVVEKITVEGQLFFLHTSAGKIIKAKKVLVATGGGPKIESYNWLTSLGHTFEHPVPSLFTFNVPSSDLKELQGISMPAAKVKVLGTKLEYQGPVLITHWGFSGPSVLKTSAWGARLLNEKNYSFKIYINWLGDYNDDTLRSELLAIIEDHKKKLVSSLSFFQIPKRLWLHLITKAEIGLEKKWMDVSKKQLNKLIESLIRSEFDVKGKTTFKEEFVTCGGIKLNEIDFRTMESKVVRGLFFAGEVLDVDGITGGFNFQNAWATGWLAGKFAFSKKEI